VFSNGVIVLAAMASVLIVVFRGETDALIPLYAVGVFTAFTLSQAGWSNTTSGYASRIGSGASRSTARVRSRPRSSRSSSAVTKFGEGAWDPRSSIIPVIVALFRPSTINYSSVAAGLKVPVGDKPRRMNHTVGRLGRRVHRGVLEALAYAEVALAEPVLAVSVVSDDEEQERNRTGGGDRNIDIRSEIVQLALRELTRPS